MKQIEKRANTLTYYIVSFFVLFIIICIATNPEIYMQSVTNGIVLWANAVLPALLPFFFFTTLLTELGAIKKMSLLFAPITRKLFNVNGIASYVYFMSILSGYPVGAKITSELYEKNIISSQEAHRITTFTSTSGPLFIIGTVGVGLLYSKTAGSIIFISHLISAVLNGLLWRKYKSKINSYSHSNTTLKNPSNNLFADSVYNSVISILLVGGYIALFFLIIDFFINIGLLTIIAKTFSPLLGNYSLPFFSGFIEMTRGCYELAPLAQNITITAIFATIIVSFGGISTHLQALAFLKKCKINYKFFLIQKITHAILGGATAFILCYFLFS